MIHGTEDSIASLIARASKENGELKVLEVVGTICRDSGKSKIQNFLLKNVFKRSVDLCKMSSQIANKSIERIYQKKTQLEHILIRPDTYIGSIEKSTQEMWIVDDSNEESIKMIKKQITFVPGLYKIFDEILVNAADNKQRDSNGMSTIKVDINQENQTIKIYNDGKGIPVTIHKKENVYVPTLIFGHLLTSSNFDDKEKKVTGGRNGYGAKLCNVFSKKFVVETSCKEYKKSFKQIWRNNMSVPDEPSIDTAAAKDYTRVTFVPDLDRFQMSELDDDIINLFKRRVYDIAASCPQVNVYLNNKRLPIKSFEDYVRLFIGDLCNDLTGQPLQIVYQKINQRWEVAVTSSDTGFQQMSFVNSIATTKGGKHVDCVADQIVNKMLDAVKKRNKTGAEIKGHQLKGHLWVFVNCLIENPTFDSQTKEFMTLAAKNFGSKCEIPDDFVKKVRDKCGTIEAVLRWAEFKQKTLLERKGGGAKTSKLKGIPKLDDANDAGTKNSMLCTLIVTEGDSAKTLAVSGLGVIGRDRYGIYPLRGKLLNVREANNTQIMNSQTITNLCKIIGLQYKEKYESPDRIKQLRYGKLMIMADQDQDGSHIKGLVINFIHYNWPHLIKHGFVEMFITPIVKVFRGDNEILFYSIPQFEEWQQANDDWMRYRVKYYKGLGTSTAKEAKEYFSDMNRHRIHFRYAGPRDDLALKLAFSKPLIEDRKDWLTRWMEERKQRKDQNLPEDYLYRENTRSVNFKSFVNKELILFSNLDNERSIPSLVDGMKPGQRKVMFTCFKRNLVKEIKVAQLVGSVAEMSSYHHGETSLMGTIINLAHDFVGSNNLNLLLPIGQFGTRIMGGKDAASARYIFTALNPLTRFIFTKNDDPILNYINDDGQFVEPEWYCPIIPMILVNGAEGIGTGWSTKVPNFNPKELIKVLRDLLHDKPISDLLPYYKGFRGTINPVDNTKVMVNGEVSILDDQTIEISELPVGVWTQNYKDTVIEPLLTGVVPTDDANANKSKKQPPKKAKTTDESKKCLISDYKEYNTDTTVRFVIKVTNEQMDFITKEGFHKVFKLQKPMSLANMVMFDAGGSIMRYDTVKDIIKDYFKVRLSVYVEQKNYRIGQLKAESLRLDNMARFILEKIDNVIKVENVKEKNILEMLKTRKYDPDPVNAWRMKIARQKASIADSLQREMAADQEEAEADETGDEQFKKSGYDYLLSMPLRSLTLEKKDELLKQQKKKADELKELSAKTERQMWLDDLDLLESEMKKQESKVFDAAVNAKKQGKKMTKKVNVNPNTLPSEIGERVKPPVSQIVAGNVCEDAKPYVINKSPLVDALMDDEVPDHVVSQFVDDDGKKKKMKKIDEKPVVEKEKPSRKRPASKQTDVSKFFAKEQKQQDEEEVKSRPVRNANKSKHLSSDDEDIKPSQKKKLALSESDFSVDGPEVSSHDEYSP